MTFQKGNTCWNNPNSIASRIQKGQHLGTTTEFKKGSVPCNKGSGKTRVSLNKYARVKAIKLWGKKCVLCKSEDKLNVHHIDKNWKNNSLENLVMLCSSCHSTLHGLEGNSGQFVKGHVPWNTNFNNTYVYKCFGQRNI